MESPKKKFAEKKEEITSPGRDRNPNKSTVAKGKLFLGDVMKQNLEKTIRIFKSSMPSYFKRNFRNHESLTSQSLSASETVQRLSSPIRVSEPKTPKNTIEKNLYVVHPTVALLQISNGIELYKVMDPKYKYFIGPGNNDKLIKKIFKNMRGWVKAFSPHSANLIWTDIKKSAIFDLVPKTKSMQKTLIPIQDFTCELLPNHLYKALATSSTLSPLKIKIYNKVEGNSELASKKKLFYNMVDYYNSINKDPFSVLPLTYHLINGSKDVNFCEFLSKFQEFSKDLTNIWIIKPGEATNRGIGITCCSALPEIISCIDDKKSFKGVNRTYIVQKYISNPFLYNNRKFDIRCYALVTVINNNIQCYFYKEGYLRTSCKEFNMDEVHDKYVHLTNDAVQKGSPTYGKFEDGNKLSYQTFQEYLDRTNAKINFFEEIYPKIREIVQDTIKATYKKLDPHKRAHCFEVLGYDFMLDEQFAPWLIEVNTNPCLALSGKCLATLIPKMLSDTFALVLDQLFPNTSSTIEKNSYELIFAEKN